MKEMHETPKGFRVLFGHLTEYMPKTEAVKQVVMDH